MMRRVMELSLVVLTLAVGNLGLSAAAFPKDEGRQSVIKSDVDVVSVYFAVRDSKKHLASQFDQQQFRVFEDGREQPIKFFAHHSDVVLNVGVLLDTGTNMAWILGEEATATSLPGNHNLDPSWCPERRGRTRDAAAANAASAAADCG